MDRHRWKHFCLMVVAALLLSACEPATKLYVISPTPDTGAIKMARASVLIAYLKRDPTVQYLQTGETIRIILCSDAIFNPHSANLRWTASLDMVARLMIMLETTSVEVAGYTNAEPRWLNLNEALSRRQAQVVAEYLWDRGLDARLVYSKGYGARVPLSANPQNAINRRIEIRFQYIPYEIGR